MKKMISVLLIAGLLLPLSLSASAEAGQRVGGWQTPDTPELTPEAQAAFDKAMEGLVGVRYVPVALLGTQLVSGMNYCILCEATVVYPGAEPYYARVTIYEDLKGNARVTDIEKLETDSTTEQAAFAEPPRPEAEPVFSPMPEEQSPKLWQRFVSAVYAVIHKEK